ncbi:hypothetical protein [Hymenobacter sp. APR13]|uniref:TapB family protein n=1 Tax=Hymenobacter sp. APR13 TaxID=1356852 RepID=UPI0004E07489|nr:hypothetical protein [Hymenobacter sp. APR13]AII54030.1 hypothetical protein N008_18850 [Hymenobacter sp. APR13]
MPFSSFRSLLLLPALAAAASSVSAQTPDAPASGPGQPFGLADNMELVYRVLDAGGKPVGEVRQRVVDLKTGEREEGKKSKVAENTMLLKSGYYARKNTLDRIQDLTFRARRDTSFTDGMGELNNDALRSFRDRKLAYSIAPLAWPNQPTVGTELPAGGVSIQVSSSVVSIATVSTMLQKRRVVSGPTALTTPAGTFQVYKVEAEREEATIPRPDMAMRSSTKQIDFYAPGVGIVRTERYTKTGKLSEVRELTSRTAATTQTYDKVKVKTKKS